MLRYLDLVDDLPGGEVFQSPCKMLRVNALHGRAHAHGGRHELDDLAFGFDFFGQPANEVQLRAD